MATVPLTPKKQVDTVIIALSSHCQVVNYTALISVDNGPKREKRSLEHQKLKARNLRLSSAIL